MSDQFVPAHDGRYVGDVEPVTLGCRIQGEAIALKTVKIIRCTQELRRKLGELSGEPGSQPDGLLGEWYANLVRIERQMCILFTSADTLLSFLVPGVRKADIAELATLFFHNLSIQLAAEGLAGAEIRAVVADRRAEYASTANRSVLGSMNDIAFQSKILISYAGGLAKADLVALTRQVNQTPMAALGYRCGSD